MYKGKDYDRELKQAGVKLDRQKPDTKPRELDVEAISDPKLPRRVHRPRPLSRGAGDIPYPQIPLRQPYSPVEKKQVKGKGPKRR